MENYKGIYFNDSKDQKFYEGGAHFKYKDLYNKLLELCNEKINIDINKKNDIFDLYLLQNKNNEEKISPKIKNIKKENSTKPHHRKTRNKKITNFSKSNSIDIECDKNNKKNNIQKRSIDNNNYHYININLNILKNTTSRITYYNRIFQKIHHNSINKNYHLTNRQNKKNLSALNKIKEKQINTDMKYEKNNSINHYNNKNKSNNNNNNIYNYCYLKFENKYNKKMPKLKTNNEKKKNIFNLGNYRYNLYDNIFLKNKIKNKLKQNKYNSFINQNSISSVSKVKNSSNNKYIKSIENNFIEKNNKSKKKLQCHIKSVDYSSMYLGLNCTKTPTYKVKNEIFNNKKPKMINEPIYNIKTVLNKNNHYENLISQANKNKTSYTKIKKHQLSLNKSKKFYNKDNIIKERLKRDTQSTEYE